MFQFGYTCSGLEGYAPWAGTISVVWSSHVGRAYQGYWTHNLWLLIFRRFGGPGGFNSGFELDIFCWSPVFLLQRWTPKCSVQENLERCPSTAALATIFGHTSKSWRVHNSSGYFTSRFSGFSNAMIIRLARFSRKQCVISSFFYPLDSSKIKVSISSQNPSVSV